MTDPIETHETLRIRSSNGEQKVVEVIKRLGDGFANYALLIQDPQITGIQCVLKKYKAGNADKNQEVKILDVLNGENLRLPVVKILDSDVTINNIEKGHIETLASGSSIQDQLPNERQALELAIRFAEFLQTCAGLQIAYRDIKPGDHIFWERDGDSVASMTVIDWNIAQYPASSDALYFDLFTFCRRLPSFFTGKLGDESNDFAYHPLEWGYQGILKKHISPRIWLLLADLSMNFVAPILPGVDQDLVLNGNYSSVNIIHAWEKIIARLKRTLSSLGNSNLLGFEFTSAIDQNGYLQRLANLGHLEEAEKIEFVKSLIYDSSVKSLISNPEYSLLPNEIILERLRLARMISPSAFRESLLISIYVSIYRTGLSKDTLAKAIYKKLLENLLEQQSPKKYYSPDDFVKLIEFAKNKASEFGKPEIEKIHAAIWANIKKEFEIWIANENFNTTTDLEEQGLALKTLTRGHPVSLAAIDVFQDSKRAKDLENDILETLEATPPQFDIALVNANGLKNYDLAKGSDYQAAIDACRKIYTLDDSTKNDLEKLQEIITELSTINIPSPFKGQYDKLTDRIIVLKKINKISAEINSLGDYHGLKDLHEEIENMEKDYPSEYPALPLLAKAWRQRLVQIIDETKDVIRKTDDTLAGISFISLSQDIKAKIYSWQQLCKECNELELMEIFETDVNAIDSGIINTKTLIKQKQEEYKAGYQILQQANGFSVSKYTEINSYLSNLKNDFAVLDENFKLWVNQEITKSTKLFFAAEKLQEIENAVLRVEIGATLQDIAEYPEATELRTRLVTKREEIDLRYQTLDSVTRLDSSIESLTAENQTVLRNVLDLEALYKRLRQESIEDVNNALNGPIDKLINVSDEFKTQTENNQSIDGLKKQIQTNFWRTALIGGINLFCLLILIVMYFLLPNPIIQPRPTSIVTFTETASATETPTSTPTETPTSTPTVTVTVVDAGGDQNPGVALPANQTQTLTPTPTSTQTIINATGTENGNNLGTAILVIVTDPNKNQPFFQTDSTKLTNFASINEYQHSDWIFKNTAYADIQMVILEKQDVVNDTKKQIAKIEITLLIKVGDLDGNTVKKGKFLFSAQHTNPDGSPLSGYVIGQAQNDFNIEKIGDPNGSYQAIKYTGWIFTNFLK